jgi:hypothetical protein
MIRAGVKLCDNPMRLTFLFFGLEYFTAGVVSAIGAYHVRRFRLVTV